MSVVGCGVVLLVDLGSAVASSSMYWWMFLIKSRAKSSTLGRGSNDTGIEQNEMVSRLILHFI